MNFLVPFHLFKLVSELDLKTVMAKRVARKEILG